MSNNSPLLRVENLRKQYGAVMAVRDVSFSVRRGEVVGLVGESGSGKTTVGRLVLRLLDATDGKINFDGIDLAAARPSQIRSLRRRMQIIFQDPFSSLNPHMRIGDALAEALIIHKLHGDRTIRRRRVDDLLTLVGLGPAYASRFPHELSGGQRQRVGIARALAVEPEFIVADEAVSALDISVQAQILNLLRALQRKLSLSLLFISHDLGVVRYLSDKVIVMYLGRVVEAAPTDVLFTSPKHPYTEALLASLPEIGTSRDTVVLKGDQPSALGTDSGCAFRTRCRYAIAQCAEIVPELKMIASERGKACIRDDIL